MGRTEKVKSTGRFGSKYGVGIRKRVVHVEDRQKNQKPCPFCGFDKVKRKAAGLYACNKCDMEFTGGAYQAETLIGKTIKKMVAQKTFLANSAELSKAKDSSYADIEKEVTESVEK